MGPLGKEHLHQPAAVQPDPVVGSQRRPQLRQPPPDLGRPPGRVSQDDDAVPPPRERRASRLRRDGTAERLMGLHALTRCFARAIPHPQEPGDRAELHDVRRGHRGLPDRLAVDQRAIARPQVDDPDAALLPDLDPGVAARQAVVSDADLASRVPPHDHPPPTRRRQADDLRPATVVDDQ